MKSVCTPTTCKQRNRCRIVLLDACGHIAFICNKREENIFNVHFFFFFCFLRKREQIYLRYLENFMKYSIIIKKEEKNVRDILWNLLAILSRQISTFFSYSYCAIKHFSFVFVSILFYLYFRISIAVNVCVCVMVVM